MRLETKGITSLGGHALRAKFLQRYGIELPVAAHGFNAGVFAFNLAAWRALDLTREVEWWIRENSASSLYQLGSQPPLTLALVGARRT